MTFSNLGRWLRSGALVVAIGLIGGVAFAAPAGLGGATGLGVRPVAASEATEAVDLQAETIAQAEQAMVALFNADRRKAGLREVVLDPAVMAVARARSTDMATRHYFSHTLPDGRKFGDVLRSAGISFGYSAEIIAWNNWPTIDGSTTAAHEGWLGSSGHRAAIHGSVYTRVGVGLAWDSRDQRWLWTGIFVDGVPPRDRVAPFVGVQIRPGSGTPGLAGESDVAGLVVDGEGSSIEEAAVAAAAPPATEPPPAIDVPTAAPPAAPEPAPATEPAFPLLRPPAWFYHL